MNLGDAIANKLVVSFCRRHSHRADGRGHARANHARAYEHTERNRTGERVRLPAARVRRIRIARKVRAMFGAIGLVVKVDDEQIDAVTALAGSGPAFVYAMIEALARGGEKWGWTNGRRCNLPPKLRSEHLN